MSALFAFVLSTPLSATEETANSAYLTLDQIFNSSRFDSESVGRFKWHRDGAFYTTWRKAEQDGVGQELVRIEPATDRTEVLVAGHSLIPPGETEPLSIDDYTFTEDESRLLLYTNSKRVWRTKSRGDYWVYDLTSRELKQLGGDAPPASLQFTRFSPDGRRVCYVRDNNLYVQNVDDLQITALTTNGSATVINGTFDWVYEEELSLRNGFRWSPDSRFIAYWQLDTAKVRKFHLVDNAAGLYPRLTFIRYPKAGEHNAQARIGVVRATGGETQWLDLPGDGRNEYVAHLEWAGRQLVLQQFSRLQNTNCLMIANPRTGKVRTLMTETDEAWVDNNNSFRWSKELRGFVWLSERNGWRHIYRISRSGKNRKQITQGDYDVIQIAAVDPKRGWIYFLASPNDPTQRYLYRVRLRGGRARRVTPLEQPGSHQYNISPDARWAFHTYSTFDRPPITTLIALPDHDVVKALADNSELRQNLDELEPCTTEFFRVDIGEGVELDGWCIKPPGFDPRQKYPVLFHVYGEPAGQTVSDRWRGKTHLWHLMLAQQGYLIMSVDNRGTPAPRGRTWRKSIYRQVGILASADQAAAVKAIIKRWPYVDADRVAIWGWSGGGSMSLNAIFRYPDLYQTAMSVAPVPVQRYYDTIYQERYMGLPSDNADGYRKGSPITYAHQLEGNLLIIHGTGDDNCHYQGAEALINELIAHNKPFTMMAYPNRRHGISEGNNTTRHLYGLLTRFLKANTPPGAARRLETTSR